MLILYHSRLNIFVFLEFILLWYYLLAIIGIHKYLHMILLIYLRKDQIAMLPNRISCMELLLNLYHMQDMDNQGKHDSMNSLIEDSIHTMAD
jgi:hypothetical protein